MPRLIQSRPAPALQQVECFSEGQRVFVLSNAAGYPVAAWGTVARLRRNDSGAWVELDELCSDRGVHPFAGDLTDPRCRWVWAWPTSCQQARPVGGRG